MNGDEQERRNKIRLVLYNFDVPQQQQQTTKNKQKITTTTPTTYFVLQVQRFVYQNRLVTFPLHFFSLGLIEVQCRR